MKTIFVSIASYRDPECQWTVKDLFNKAKYPERIFIGICWQFIAQQDSQCFLISTRPKQVRQIDYDVAQAKGASWAKAQAMTLWQGEDYILNIDSHMRFAQNWDEQMIDMLVICPSDKPVLSTYPAEYTPPNQLVFSTPHLVAKKFDENSKMLHLRSYLKTLSEPKRSAFVAGGFIFSSAALFRDVPWDPEIYFIGEEISFAVRTWSYGWDVFSPHICLIHHYYLRTEGIKHWHDNKQWNTLELNSVKRVRHLLETELSNDVKIAACFSLGKERTLCAYQLFSGIDFKKLVYTEAASRGEVILKCLFDSDSSGQDSA